GLPELTILDSESHDFDEGQYACSKDQFISNVVGKGMPRERIFPVQGFFDQTCNEDTITAFDLKKASIVWLDADLYSSTVTVLDFIRPLLQDGTVLIFDDWFSYRGNPHKGVQRAFNEWRVTLTDHFVLNEYQRDSWK